MVVPMFVYSVTVPDEPRISWFASATASRMIDWTRRGSGSSAASRRLRARRDDLDGHSARFLLPAGLPSHRPRETSTMDVAGDEQLNVASEEPPSADGGPAGDVEVVFVVLAIVANRRDYVPTRSRARREAESATREPDIRRSYDVANRLPRTKRAYHVPESPEPTHLARLFRDQCQGLVPRPGGTAVATRAQAPPHFLSRQRNDCH